MKAASPSETRLRALLDAGVAITSELSLDALLQRLTVVAAELTNAHHAALGVIDRSGSQLGRFLTHGIDAETQRVIGDLPRGRGILGVLIRGATPLRLHDLSEDPRSAGFPPGHPPMRSFLGVPVLLRGVACGNLYLTEKHDGEDFTEADQELVTLLAGQAAVAIENARLYEAATRWSRQLESLNEIGNALVTETDLDRLLDLVALRLRELLDARLVTVALPRGADELRYAVAVGEGGDELVGWRPKALDDFGLMPALERLTTNFSEQTGIAVDLQAALPEERLPAPVETALYRIVQESLTNVVKHAGARRVSILVTRRGRSAAVVVEDDGRGFDTKDVREGAFGLTGMREPVGLFRGRLTVESHEGAGTTLAGEVPLA